MGDDVTGANPLGYFGGANVVGQAPPSIYMEFFGTRQKWTAKEDGLHIEEERMNKETGRWEPHFQYVIPPRR